MNNWFRSWHGAPTDSKWLVIARKAGVAPGIVSAVVWALFDHASQSEQRGCIADFDVETYAAFSGFDEEQISAVIAALKDKGIIGPDGGFKNWSKRQPKREDDNSTERSRAFRQKQKENERDATQCNATQRMATPDKRREEEKREEEKEDDDTGAGDAAGDAAQSAGRHQSKYAFEAGVIRLTEIDLERWRRAYNHLASLEAALFSLSEWAGRPENRPKWFNAVSGALAKKNEEARLAVERIKAEAVAGAKSAASLSFRERGKI